MSHENSETVEGPGGLWYNTSQVVWPRPLNGPFMVRGTAEQSAKRRSKQNDPTFGDLQLYAPLSPLGNPNALPKTFAEWLGMIAAEMTQRQMNPSGPR